MKIFEQSQYNCHSVVKHAGFLGTESAEIVEEAQLKLAQNSETVVPPTVTDK